MDANIASGETPPGVESDNSKNAIMCAMCGKVEDFFDAQDARWEIQENLEYICDECIAKKKATAEEQKENAEKNEKSIAEKVWNYIDNNKDEIIEKALDNACDIASVTVWLDGINGAEEDMTICTGTYTQGTYENPENIRDSICVLSIDPITQSPGTFDYESEAQCIVMHNDKIYRNPGHCDYITPSGDEKYIKENEMDEEEQWENLLECVRIGLFEYMGSEEYECMINAQLEG